MAAFEINVYKSKETINCFNSDDIIKRKLNVYLQCLSQGTRGGRKEKNFLQFSAVLFGGSLDKFLSNKMIIFYCVRHKRLSNKNSFCVRIYRSTL